MMRRSRTGPAGFTLVELLAVILIISILMALLLAAVQKVKDSSKRADAVARITAINAAIGTFKSATSAKFIPAGQVDIDTTSATYGQVIGPFRLMSQYPVVASPHPNDLSTNCFEAQYIASLFPRSNPASFIDPSTTLHYTQILQTKLDANQTLLFFLNGMQVPDGAGHTNFTGFSSNPQYPFNPITQTQGANESRKGPYLELTPNRYTVGTAANSFAHVIDSYGSPFAYFSAWNGKAGAYGGYNQYTIGTALPYQNGGTYLNASGWQIISAGKDLVFHDPTLVATTTFIDWSNLDLSKHGAGDSQDNLTNFSNAVLGAGPN